MNIKPMLARLQTTIGRDDLSEQMLLLTGAKNPVFEEAESAKPITLVVGYNGSSNSHAALDITLLIAHQTRLATSKQVVVKVVCVVDRNEGWEFPDHFNTSTFEKMRSELLTASTSNSATSVLTRSKISAVATAPTLKAKSACSIEDSLLQAETILWQARYLVEEWRDSFAAHLRIGDLAKELREVVQLESADLLVLGCYANKHPIIRKLGANFPCPVLGIPHPNEGLWARE